MSREFGHGRGDCRDLIQGLQVRLNRQVGVDLRGREGGGWCYARGQFHSLTTSIRVARASIIMQEGLMARKRLKRSECGNQRALCGERSGNSGLVVSLQGHHSPALARIPLHCPPDRASGRRSHGLDRRGAALPVNLRRLSGGHEGLGPPNSRLRESLISSASRP